MVNPKSPVTIVLDKTYGNRAINDAKCGAVWLVSSPEIEAAMQELRRDFVGRPEDLTVFDATYEDVEKLCLLTIPMVDLHHPEMSELIIVGVMLTPQMRTDLGKRLN